jgi:hypothetical protein
VPARLRGGDGPAWAAVEGATAHRMGEAFRIREAPIALFGLVLPQNLKFTGLTHNFEVDPAV